jgi:EmrB/QacA subfamily drug resistance transporter
MIGVHRGPCDEGLIRAAKAQPAAGPVRKRWVLIATILASSLAFVDGSIVNVALPAIQRDLAASGEAAAWVMNAYLLALGALVLIGGAAADRIGRRRVLVWGVGLFAAASIGCALAPSVPVLLIGRAVQGVGAALLTPASLAILGASFSDAERGQAIGAWAGFGSVTAAVGPALGGWLVDLLSWRAAFFVNIPLALAAVALALWAVPESRETEAEGLDVPGAALGAGGLGVLAWALTSAPARGFGSPLILAALAASAALLLAFWIWEGRARSPMLPRRMFRSREFVGANLLTLLLYAALGGALFFLPFELIRAHGYPATAAGAALAPFAVVMGLGSPLAGRLSGRIGPRWPLTAGPVIAGAGFGLLAASAAEPSYWRGVLPGMLVLAVGMTLAVAPLTDTVMSALGPQDAGKASGVNNAVARIAGLLAIAVMTLVFAARFDAALDRMGVPQDQRPGRGQALTVNPSGAHGTSSQAERAAFEEAYRVVLTLAAALAAAGGLSAFVTIRRR